MGADTEDTFAVSLKGQGISLEKEVDKRTALAIFAAVMGETEMVEAQRPNQAGALSFKAKLSLREFLTEVDPKTHNERIVAIGHYLHEQKSQDAFSKDDIEAGYKSAREKLPKNLSRDLGRTVAAGLIDEADGNATFYVTNTGAKAVENCFGRQASSDQKN